jgi:hypothetical protein
MLKMMSVYSVTKTPWNRSILNSRSGFSCDFGGTFRLLVKFNPHSMEEDEMRKLGYVIAALGAIAVAAPSIASAETLWSSIAITAGIIATTDGTAIMAGATTTRWWS